MLEEKTNKDKALGEFETLVLIAILRLGSEAYGSSIQQQIKLHTDRDVLIGAIYVALERLEKKGYVAATLGESTAKRGGRRKKYFELTLTGESKLNATLSSINAMIKDTPLIGLFA